MTTDKSHSVGPNHRKHRWFYGVCMSEVMKIKMGTVKKDVTAYGNKFWIQVEDNSNTSNSDLEHLVDKEVTVIIGSVSAIDDLIKERDLL